MGALRATRSNLMIELKKTYTGQKEGAKLAVSLRREPRARFCQFPQAHSLAGQTGREKQSNILATGRQIRPAGLASPGTQDVDAKAQEIETDNRRGDDARDDM